MSIANPSTRSKKSSCTADLVAAGRFAPSPTGPLHLGSLLAATASFLDARARGGAWYVRVDDLDIYRNQPGAEADILAGLEAHALHWDASPQRQSERVDRYQAALQQLSESGMLFYCSCSRRKLKGLAVYPGHCRGQELPSPECAVRVAVDDVQIAFQDLIRGPQHAVLKDTVGDFIVRRRDGLIAYQLATAVDDGEASITHVIRGSDLLDNTPRQVYLMQALGLQPPRYAHVPTLLQQDGSKLSKQTGAPGLDPKHATANLNRVLRYLGINPPAEARDWSPTELVAFGIANWSISAVPTSDIVASP